MGKSKILSALEREKVDFYHAEGWSNRKIAEKLNRSSRTVDRYLKDPKSYGNRYKGRNQALSAREKRKILRLASNSTQSAAKIRQLAGVKASLSTVKRTIHAAKHIKRLKIKKKPPLDAVRKQKRLQFAKNYMTWAVQIETRTNDWRLVVFSDEKRFNLDGPDGFQYYFHDLRKEEICLSRHHSREGGVMVWGAITFYGTVDLIFVDQSINGIRYKSMLESVFPKIRELFGPLPWIFQQDNAPIHNARVVKSFISSQNVELMSWPPYSPDLNIIENVWGWMSRKVYEGGRQYEDKESLIVAIKLAWDEISLDYLHTLYSSLKNRIFEVINKNGGSTHY